MDRAYGLSTTPGLLKLSPNDIPSPSPNGMLPLKVGSFSNPANNLDNLAGKSAHVLADNTSKPSLLVSIENMSERRNVLVKFDSAAVERIVQEKPDGQAAKLFQGRGSSSFILYGKRLADFLNETGLQVQKDGTVFVSDRLKVEFRNSRREARVTASPEDRAERRSPGSSLTRETRSTAGAAGALTDYIFGSPPTVQPGTGEQIYVGVNVNSRNRFTTVAINGGGGTIDVQGAGALNHLVNTGGSIKLEANGGQNFMQNYGGDIRSLNEGGAVRLVNNDTYINSVNLSGNTNLRFQGASSSITLDNTGGLLDIAGSSDGASFFVRNSGETRLASSDFSGIAVVENSGGSVDAELTGKGGYVEIVNEGGALLLAGGPPGVTANLRNGAGSLSLVSAGPGGDSLDVRNGPGNAEIRNNGKFERLAVDSEKGNLFFENLGTAENIVINASSPETHIVTSFSRADVFVENRGQRLNLTTRTKGAVSVTNAGSAQISSKLGSGDLTVENGAGKLRLDVGAGRGDVTVRHASARKLDVEIRGRSGDIAVNVGERGELTLLASGPASMHVVSEGAVIAIDHRGDGALQVTNPVKLAGLAVGRGVGDVLVEGERVDAPPGAKVNLTKGARGNSIEITQG